MKTLTKPITIACLLLIGILITAGAIASASDTMSQNQSPVKLQQQFIEAGKAYDEGKTQDAITIYKHLLKQGFSSVELLYNLGNANFKQGELGKAVLNYRRAWYQAPRDPDITANISFAFDEIGVNPPPEKISNELIFHRLNLHEWMVITVIAYWLVASLICLIFFFPLQRYWLSRLTIGATVLLVIGLWGSYSWLTLYIHPELVITQPRQEALFAPLEGSTAHFSIPEGAVTRLKKRNDDWVEVIYDGKRGWIKDNACAAVYTLKALR